MASSSFFAVAWASLTCGACKSRPQERSCRKTKDDNMGDVISPLSILANHILPFRLLERQHVEGIFEVCWEELHPLVFFNATFQDLVNSSYKICHLRQDDSFTDLCQSIYATPPAIHHQSALPFSIVLFLHDASKFGQLGAISNLLLDLIPGVNPFSSSSIDHLLYQFFCWFTCFFKASIVHCSPVEVLQQHHLVWRPQPHLSRSWSQGTRRCSRWVLRCPAEILTRSIPEVCTCLDLLPPSTSFSIGRLADPAGLPPLQTQQLAPFWLAAPIPCWCPLWSLGTGTPLPHLSNSYPRPVVSSVQRFQALDSFSLLILDFWDLQLPSCSPPLWLASLSSSPACLLSANLAWFALIRTSLSSVPQPCKFFVASISSQGLIWASMTMLCSKPCTSHKGTPVPG